MRTTFETIRLDRRNTVRVETGYVAEAKFGESKEPGGVIDYKRITNEECPNCRGLGIEEICVGPLPIAVDMNVDCRKCLGTGFKLVDL